MLPKRVSDDPRQINFLRKQFLFAEIFRSRKSFLAFLGWLPVRPSGCTATSTAPGAEARPHDGLACQVSAATVLGKGSHGRRFHSTIDAPRPLLSGFVTERDTGAQDSICANFAMEKLQIRRVDFHPFVPEHGRERGHYGSFPGGFRWNQRRTPVGRV